jgi:hypothetical protein
MTLGEAIIAKYSIGQPIQRALSAWVSASSCEKTKMGILKTKLVYIET